MAERFGNDRDIQKLLQKSIERHAVKIKDDNESERHSYFPLSDNCEHLGREQSISCGLEAVISYLTK
jgi:hypothetical protein